MPPCCPFLGGYGWVIPLVFLTVMIVMVVLFCRRGGWLGCCGPMHQHDQRTPSETPLDILRRRYAAGEITKDQFEQMKRDIE